MAGHRPYPFWLKFVSNRLRSFQLMFTPASFTGSFVFTLASVLAVFGGSAFHEYRLRQLTSEFTLLRGERSYWCQYRCLIIYGAFGALVGFILFWAFGCCCLCRGPSCERRWRAAKAPQELPSREAEYRRKVTALSISDSGEVQSLANEVYVPRSTRSNTF